MPGASIRKALVDEPARSKEKMMTQYKPTDAELDRMGIQRVPADVYLWGGFRYSNASDAVAAAKRGQKA
jgi:hypothetical protein